MYMVMDNTNLYIAQSVYDAVGVGRSMQLWQGESADIFWGFYDADTVKTWGPFTSKDQRFGCLWNAVGDLRFPKDGGANTTITGQQIETFVDTMAGTAVWEMKIPLNKLPGSFTPVDGMQMPWTVWENTVNDAGARGDVLIVGCADNNNSGKGQENKFLPVNPNRWERPGTWGRIMISTTPTGVEENPAVNPYTYELSANYPNPFNPTTNINFTLAKAGDVKLIVYNLLGQKVATLVDSHMDAGKQSIKFDASKLSSGVYFYRLDAGSFSSVKKMMLLK
jgi:hypothetical protein